MDAKFDIWIYYPMPFRDDLDASLRKFSGWYGSGISFAGHEDTRDHSIKGDFKDLAAILVLCPDDGHIKVKRIVANTKVDPIGKPNAT